jgi:hypothetical protein
MPGIKKRRILNIILHKSPRSVGLEVFDKGKDIHQLQITKKTA